MDADFSNLAKKFNAMKSVVRVPDTDPKYKISILASKQVLVLKLLRACLNCNQVELNNFGAGALSCGLVAWLAGWAVSYSHNFCNKVKYEISSL